MGKSSDPTIYRAKVPLPDPVPDVPLSTPEFEGVRAAMWAYRPGCTARRLVATVEADRAELAKLRDDLDDAFAHVGQLQARIL